MAEISSRRALRIAEVCEVTGVGRTTIYAAIRDRRLRAHKWGRSTIVLAEELESFLKSLPIVDGVEDQSEYSKVSE